MKIAQEALIWAIEDYKKSKDFKKEVFEGNDEAYWIRYGDGRDAAAKLYPNLDLGNITIQAPKERVMEQL
ncbi:putative shewanella-like protein phosphatase 2 [Cocos nucifera]|nr:putative shewanella-like protein phosphatase 2 [Cocos nucifera]